jgi:AraC-like DNA-binding protein
MGIAADPVTQVADAAHVAELIGGILDRLRGRGQGLGAHTSSAVASLVAAVHDARAHRVAPKGSGRPDVSDWLLPRLRANLARHWNITILADEAGLSPSQLHRVFRLETGLSPMSWLRRERITAAKLLLVQPGLSVQRVAETVGYADPFHFSRDFRTLTGLSPRQFRNTLGP